MRASAPFPNRHRRWCHEAPVGTIRASSAGRDGGARRHATGYDKRRRATCGGASCAKPRGSAQRWCRYIAFMAGWAGGRDRQGEWRGLTARLASAIAPAVSTSGAIVAGGRGRNSVQCIMVIKSASTTPVDDTEQSHMRPVCIDVLVWRLAVQSPIIGHAVRLQHPQETLMYPTPRETPRRSSNNDLVRWTWQRRRHPSFYWNPSKWVIRRRMVRLG